MTTKKKSARFTYNYYDETGRRRTKTFTADTKGAARRLSEAWEDEHLVDGKPAVSVSEALQRYIDAKRGVLSPSTIRLYESMQKKRFKSIEDVAIRRLTKTVVQTWISELSASGLEPKSVRNYYGLLTAAVAMQDDTIRIHAQLPQPKKFESYCPSDADINALITQIQRNGDGELLRAVLLAAFGPCRRSEVCALTSDDIHGTTVYIRRAVVKDQNGSWVLKYPKTKDSYRKIVYPSFVTDLCKGIQGNIIQSTPDSIGDKFRDTLKQAGIRHFRFHDLRHYGASIMMYMGVSQRTIESRGGWSPNSPVLKRVYQNTIEEKERAENEKINQYFSRFEVNFEVKDAESTV